METEPKLEGPLHPYGKFHNFFFWTLPLSCIANKKSFDRDKSKSVLQKRTDCVCFSWLSRSGRCCFCLMSQIRPFLLWNNVLLGIFSKKEEKKLGIFPNRGGRGSPQFPTYFIYDFVKQWVKWCFQKVFFVCFQESK